MLSLEVVTEAARAEVAKYALRNFSDTEDFTGNLRICSDDLSAMALDLERLLGVRLDRREYRKANKVLELAKAPYSALSASNAR